ncbi:MAG TPA: CDP-alcohol phosphatidyltransferase family protein [Polyangia bacterium]|nr:CDP-alcohol phosphatidyltransferase family protein [Polyangia bacterium]
MMITEGAGELNRVARVTPEVVTRLTTPTYHERIPILMRATEDEARGARMRIGGLRVIDRAIRQLAKLGDAKVLIVADGSIPLPRRLPANVEVHEVEGDAGATVARLCAELGSEVRVLGADNVWIQPARFDRAIRVVDAASRRLAENEIYLDLQRGTVGLVDRALNRRVSSVLTRAIVSKLPLVPALVTLAAGFVGVYGALMIATGASANVLLGFLLLQGSIVLDGCASELARVRLHQSALGAWLDTMVGDFLNVVMILAVGLALWRHGGTYLDMKMALVSAALTLFYVVVSYRELIRQRQGDVMKLRWWFAYGQPLRSLSGAGAGQLKAVMLLGRRDVVVLLGLALAYFDQLPIVALYMMIISLVRAAGALGQLLTPDWRVRPPG